MISLDEARAALVEAYTDKRETEQEHDYANRFSSYEVWHEVADRLQRSKARLDAALKQYNAVRAQDQLAATCAAFGRGTLIETTI